LVLNAIASHESYLLRPYIASEAEQGVDPVTEPTPSFPVRQTGTAPTEVRNKCRSGASGAAAGGAATVPVRNGAVVIYTPHTLRFAVLLTVANSFLDACTYLGCGGVFANLQTGNVILFAIHLSERHWGASLSRLWPMFTFAAGVALSSHIKSGRVDKVVAQPLPWMMASQAAILAAVGFLPATLPRSLVVVPISFLGGIQIGLFRSIGDLVYMPLATTGNLMRVVEAGYAFFVEKNNSSRRVFMVYAGVIGAFAAGAIAGAFTTRAWGLHAICVPAGLLAVTVILFVIDEREGTVGAQ
jgi:uncharacterized membrane protein YoaK (UPF0700 family)